MTSIMKPGTLVKITPHIPEIEACRVFLQPDGSWESQLFDEDDKTAVRVFRTFKGFSTNEVGMIVHCDCYNEDVLQRMSGQTCGNYYIVMFDNEFFFFLHSQNYLEPIK